MKVALDLTWLGEGGGGGTGRAAVELLRELPGAGVEVLALAGPRTPASALGDAPVRRVRDAALVRLVGLPALARGCDVLHGPAGVVALTGAPARVVTIYDLIWLREGDAWGSARARAATARQQRLAARRADRVITASQASRDDLVATFGLDAERVDVVPLGVRPPAAPGDGARARAALGIPEGAAIVLCVAQHRPYKRLDVLPAALPDGAHLVLPGAPTAYSEPLRGPRVHLPGLVGDAELEDLYAAADVFVLPSAMEGFGLPVLEAMARGLPVACSDRWSLPEVAGDAATLFDPDDPQAVREAIAAALADTQVPSDLALGDVQGRRERAGAGRGDLASRGRERAALFTWARTARETVAVYERALAERRRR